MTGSLDDHTGVTSPTLFPAASVPTATICRLVKATTDVTGALTVRVASVPAVTLTRALSRLLASAVAAATIHAVPGFIPATVAA